MPKSHAQSDTILRRFIGVTASSFPATYVNLLTAAPTASNPTGWVEWRSETNTPIVRKQVFNSLQTDGSPYWSDPFIDSNLKYIKNTNAISWASSDTTTLLDASQTVVGVGVFTTVETQYGNNASGTPDVLTDLVYWTELPNSLTFVNNEAVLFLDGDLKVTEQ